MVEKTELTQGHGGCLSPGSVDHLALLLQVPWDSGEGLLWGLGIGASLGALWLIILYATFYSYIYILMDDLQIFGCLILSQCILRELKVDFKKLNHFKNYLTVS